MTVIKISSDIRSKNNFDIIRLLAALSVIISHSYDLLGLGVKDILHRTTQGGILFSDLGVWTFFIISGYLIDQSLERSSGVLDYFWRRIVRIYPGLIVVVLVSMFILGPLHSALPVRAYFSEPDVYEYGITATLIQIRYFLPGVFTSNPLQFVNGSLWTLPYEFSLYVLISFQLLFKSKVLQKAVIYTSLAAFLIIWAAGWKFPPIPFIGMGIEEIAFLGVFFLIGSLVNKFRLLPQLARLNHLVVASCFMIGLFFAPKALFAFVALPIFIFNIAFFKPEKINFVSRYGDFSYGTYIYAFLIQQILVHYFALNVYELILLASVLSVLLGMVSWKLIEKPALKFRHLFSAKKAPAGKLLSFNPKA